jgi:23S rRNA (guanine745-N1)-methyltransferase
MAVEPLNALACPLDGKALTPERQAWRCAGGHSFDTARQGYVNLLPVQNKRSKDPGDSKDMVAARQRFLNAGHYRPIARAVSQMVLHGLAGQAHELCCLDAGCGEGYYLRELAAAASDTTLCLSGLDISKWAVQAAAKQDARPRWIVGSNAGLPILPGTVDRVLCLFGFAVYSEFHRVLKPGGLLIKADAGADHLRELREIIYPTLKPQKAAGRDVPEGFAVVATDTLRFALTLDSPDAIADLLAMTPHFYRAPVEGRDKAGRLETLTVTVEIDLAQLRRV